jgi:hypothetical protein
MSRNIQRSEVGDRPGARSQERGAALVVALLVMVICAILGASAIMTSTTDLQISRQERIYHQAFANADAGVQWLLSQNLDEIYQSGRSRSELNETIESFGSARGTLFSIARPTDDADESQVFKDAGKETRAGGSQFPVYLVRIDGKDTRGVGTVRIVAEMRVPPVGEVDRPGGPHGY